MIEVFHTATNVNSKPLYESIISELNDTTLSPTFFDWTNEIHPKTPGLRKRRGSLPRHGDQKLNPTPPLTLNISKLSTLTSSPWRSRTSGLSI